MEMNRDKLIELFKRGMRYPSGTHWLWVWRCFQITVRSGGVVELDEYENFSTDGVLRVSRAQMFHVGRSVLHLKNGQVFEETGNGWGPFSPPAAAADNKQENA